MRTPSTNTKIYYKGKVLNAKTMFNCMGMDSSSVTIPKDVSASSIRTLIGNMMAVPVVGAIELAVLSALGVGPTMVEKPQPSRI